MLSHIHHPLLEKLRTSCSTDIGLLIARLALGGAFIFHGHMKLFGGLSSVVGMFASRGIPMPEVMAPFIAGLEFFGGILLLAGLLSRLVGFLLACDMGVAILTGLSRATWGAHELEILLFATAALVFLAGPGCVSIDAWLYRMSKKAHQDAMPVPKA